MAPAEDSVPGNPDPQTTMEIAALSFIASHHSPVGSSRLSAALTDAGIVVSEATAGRYLRALDQRGYTDPVRATRGRVLTEAGQRRLEDLLRRRRRASLSADLANAASADDIGALLDLLQVRRAIEPEAVRLATLNASDAELAEVVAVAEHHIRAVGGGDDTVIVSKNFHDMVVEVSGNAILRAVMALLLASANDRLIELLDRIVY
ncbi:MAG: FCD domain-containing protein, partial [Thermomicrobiales bacterium]